MNHLDNLIILQNYLIDKFKDTIVSNIEYNELNLLLIDKDFLEKVVSFLKNDYNCSFSQLIDICAVDHPGREKRFMVVYHFLSLRHNLRLRLKIAIREDEEISSVIAMFSNANWYEREVYDMFGIKFTNHPDLRRILTDYNFEGYPLRKDFPLTGFVEVAYDNNTKEVIYKPVELQQEYRQFDFEMPWEQTRKIIQDKQ